MKKRRITVVIFAIVIVLSNLPPLNYIFDYVIDETHYRYYNSTKSFDVTDRAGNNIQGIKSSFADFLKHNNVDPSDKILYRSFWKNPLAFWRWHTYLKNDVRYQLPYKN